MKTGMGTGVENGEKSFVSTLEKREVRVPMINLLRSHALQPAIRAAAVSWLAFLPHCASAELFSVPLHRTNDWLFLNYRKIPPNTFRVCPAGLEIGVTNSASPAVFPLPSPVYVKQLRVSGKIIGSLKMVPGKQGEKGFDDYAIRVGLVESGSRSLSRREKLVAAEWVRKLFALAPPGMGICRIHFFNVGTDAKQIGRSRTHPLSDLMEETVVAVPDAAGRFTFSHRFEQAVNVLGVWIASDGDDTKSAFTVRLEEVELESPATAKQ